MKKKSLAEVIYYALNCAIDDRRSLIDAYDGDKKEQAVKDAEQWIRMFSETKTKLFGNEKVREDPFKGATSQSILKALASGVGFSEYFNASNHDSNHISGE